MRRILSTWWPLAASWVLMALELPALSAVIARLSNPQINLAAWGGVVFPLTLIMEAPIIMLLAASTALSKDWGSYCKIRRYMMTAGAGLTALHILVAFTPLYDAVVVGLIGAPAEIVEPARIGIRLMIPWTWSIAYRRFNQGVLIRFGHSAAVGMGTIVRLSADILILVIGLLIGIIPGVVVAATAAVTGVMSEAVYAGLRVRPVLHRQVKLAPSVAEPIDLRSFLAFYIPLAMTSLLVLLVQPIGSAAISRMPRALESLAVWPVISGLVFFLRSSGVAYNEVVVTLVDERHMVPYLRRFAVLLIGCATVLLVLVAGTPLAGFWFESLSALDPPLATLARNALWFALPLPALNVLQSWFQGVIVHSRQTRPVTEAVTISLVLSVLILALGVIWGRTPGLLVGGLAFSIGALAQGGWLWLRSGPAMRMLDANQSRVLI
jgi:hypothetical protein